MFAIDTDVKVKNYYTTEMQSVFNVKDDKMKQWNCSCPVILVLIKCRECSYSRSVLSVIISTLVNLSSIAIKIDVCVFYSLLCST